MTTTAQQQTSATTTPRAPARLLHGVDRERRESAERWLIAAADSPRDALTDWGSHGLAVLRAGRLWDIVRIPYAALHPAFDRATGPDVLRRRLTELGVAGPSFCDPYRPTVYVMVPAGTDREWPRNGLRAGVECLGSSDRYVHQVGVPRIDRLAPPSWYWLTPPDRDVPGHADWQHLSRVLRSGAPAPGAP